MNKKVKLIILSIIVLLITTGCSINCNITIRDDRSILEEIQVVQKNSILKEVYGDYKKEINNKLKNYKEHQVYGEYNIKKLYKSEYSGLEFSKIFRYGDYNNSPARMEAFNSYSFIEQDGYYVLNLAYPVEENIYPDTSDLKSKVDDVHVNIRSYLKVVDSNCDSYDKKTKTYTWNLDDNFYNNKQRIYIKLSKEKDNMLILKDFYKNHMFVINAILLVLVSLLAFSLYIFNKYKKGMRI